jgi:hypothetical protein
VTGVAALAGANRLLTGMLDSLDGKYGPVDEALVAKYTELL